MAVTLVSTISAEDANAYCDLAYADDYFENHINSTKSALWASKSDEQKTLALIHGCYALEQLKFTIPTSSYPFDAQLQYDNLNHRYYYSIPAIPGQAVKYSSLQRLQFPRNLDENSSGVFIPEEVKMANCEQAVFLMSFDETALTTGLQGVTQEYIQAGPVTISTKYGNPGSGSAVAPMSLQLINKFILRSSGTRMQRA